MAPSTPVSGINLGGGLRPPSSSEGAATAPSDTSPEEGWRGQSPRSKAATPAARGTSLWRDGGRRLLRNRLAVAGGVVIVLLCLIALFADVLMPLPHTKPNFGRLNDPASRPVPLRAGPGGRRL